MASTGMKRHWAPAGSSRALLDRYKISVNDAANGIPIGHPTPHNVMHNRAFHTGVESRLKNIESSMRDEGYGRKAIRSVLRSELRSIGNEVLESVE